MDQPSSPPPASSLTARARSRTPPEIHVRVSWCKSCGLCVDYCKQGALEMEAELPRVVNAGRCTRCLLCEAICPDFAITVREPGDVSGGEP